MRAADERGSATVLVTAVVGLLCFVAVGLCGVAGLVVTHRSAQSAADLASLAGAQAVQAGAPGCSAAAEVASANGGRTSACSVLGEDVRVEVSVVPPGALRLVGEVRASARAGP